MIFWKSFIAVMVVLTIGTKLASAQDLVTIDSFGIWTFNRLGYPETTFTPTSTDPRALATYIMPSWAAQGPDQWFLMRLHFDLEIAEDSEPGTVVLSGYTSGHAAAQIHFRVMPFGESMMIDWTLLASSMATGGTSLYRGTSRRHSSTTCREQGRYRA